MRSPDADGNVLAAFTPVRGWQTAVISDPGMTVGETYTLYTGGGLSAANDDGFAEDGTLTGGTAAQSFTLSSVSTTVGSAGGMNPGGGGMNPGGGGTPPAVWAAALAGNSVSFSLSDSGGRKYPVRRRILPERQVFPVG